MPSTLQSDAKQQTVVSVKSRPQVLQSRMPELGRAARPVQPPIGPVLMPSDVPVWSVGPVETSMAEEPIVDARQQRQLFDHIGLHADDEEILYPSSDEFNLELDIELALLDRPPPPRFLPPAMTPR